MRTFFIFGLASISFALTGCEKPEEQSEASIPSNYPVVGMIDSGDHQVILHTSDSGPLYSIRTSEGELLATEIDRESFASDFPQMFHQIQGLWAENFIDSSNPKNLTLPVGR